MSKRPEDLTTVGGRLRSALEGAKKSQKALADHFGISEQAVSQWIRNETAPDRGKIFELGKLLGVMAQWIVDGTAPRLAPENSQDSVTTPEINVYAMPRDVSVYSGAIAGVDDLVAFEFNGQEMDRARRPPRLAGVKDAYALYVLGSSMAPWREQGELVYVHPHIPPKPGDYVVVQLKPESDGGPIPAYIKRLVRRTATEVRLAQYRPEKELSIPAGKVWKIHRIMDWSELLGI